jgi:hypothetical protein
MRPTSLLRRPAAAIVAILAITVLAIGTPDSSLAAADGLTWKISQQAWTSSSLAPAHSTDLPATKDPVNGFVLPTESAFFSPLSGAMNVSFDGAVTLGNFVQGNYRIKFENLRVEVDGAGNGVVSADVSYCNPGACAGPWVGPYVGVTLTTFILPDAAVTDTGSHVEFTITPEWASVGQQFDQAFLNSIPPYASHFRATGSPSDPLKPPAPLTVSFDYTVAVGGEVSLAVAGSDSAGSTAELAGLAAIVSIALLAAGGTVFATRRRS